MSKSRLLVGTILLLAVFATAVFLVVSLSNKAIDGDLGVASEPEDDRTQEPVIVEPEIPQPLNCTVGLYTGQGSWDKDLEAMRNFLKEYDLACIEIDQETISSRDLNALCDILVLVGGASSKYLNCIGNHDNISSFVEKGGCFVGFCAGAYYASSTMCWKGSRYDYPLKLFSGDAVGPLSGYLPWGSLSTVDLNPEIPFNREFADSIEMWYFDGPCFSGFDETNVDVLARYRANDAAAAIAFSYGRGRVLLLGPHPELGYIPSEELVQTEGGSGAQWPWLYAALQWLFAEAAV